jgi:hypothetical protein
MHWRNSRGSFQGTASSGRCRIVLVLWLFLVQFGLSEELLVTGDPVSSDFLKPILSERGWKSCPTGDLAPGESWISPQGDRVINVDWSPPEPYIVALSDHPEKVERRGGLFFGGLTPFRTLLFQYYHLGKLRGADPNLTFVVQNSGSRPATLHLQRGIGRTSLDYFSSGHTNNVRWFQALQRKLGYFVEISPGDTIELFRQPMPREEVVSGTLGLTQTSGPPLSFAFVARPDDREAISLNNLLKKDDVHSRGFYPAARQVLRRTFRLGQDPINLAVGAVRQQTFSGVRELRGDYGVTYDMHLELRNDGQREGLIELVFNPRGGAATGTFLLDGDVIEVENTEAFAERVFHTIKLVPGETRNLRLQTIPEGASSYPVRIVVRKG